MFGDNAVLSFPIIQNQKEHSTVAGAEKKVAENSGVTLWWSGDWISEWFGGKYLEIGEPGLQRWQYRL